jgi:hypothetical protein
LWVPRCGGKFGVLTEIGVAKVSAQQKPFKAKRLAFSTGLRFGEKANVDKNFRPYWKRVVQFT